MTRYLKGISASPDGNLADILKNMALFAESEDVDYADTGTSVTLFAHPANVNVLGVLCVVETAFGGSITVGPKIAIGDGSTSGLYGTFKGCLKDAGSYMLWLGKELTTAGSIVADVTATGASAGSCKFIVVYQPNSNENRLFTR